MPTGGIQVWASVAEVPNPAYRLEKDHCCGPPASRVSLPDWEASCSRSFSLHPEKDRTAFLSLRGMVQTTTQLPRRKPRVLAALVVASFLGVGPAGASRLLAAPLKPAKATTAKPAKGTPTTKALAKKTQKSDSDTSAGRDKFCAALLASRAQIVENLGLGTGSTTQEIIASMSVLNRQTQIELADLAHLKILKFAALSTAADYKVIGAEAALQPKLDNLKAELEATLRAVASNADFGGFETLQAYAISRCNFSMFVADLDNLDAAPDDASIAKLMADVDANAAEIAKVQFPPAPPKSANWPRKSRYIGVAKSIDIPALLPEVLKP